MITQTLRPGDIPEELDQIRQKTRRIRQSWSPEERRERLIRGRQKRAEMLSLLIGRKEIRRQAGRLNVEPRPGGERVGDPLAAGAPFKTRLLS